MRYRKYTRQVSCGLLLSLILHCESVSSQGSARVRMEPGLVWVSATNDAVMHKDYEETVSVVSVGELGKSTASEWAIPDHQSPEGVRRLSGRGLERSQDSEHARKIMLWSSAGDPETIPGTTGATPSADVFNEIRTKGEASIAVGAVSKSDTQSLGALSSLVAGRKYFRGIVKRVGNEQVRLLLDGVPTLLNTVHVVGTLSVGDDRANVEFWWLDDPATRLALKFEFQGSVSQVVRITRPTLNDNAIQNALAGTSCRSELPGIYFLTDSAQLLPESQPAILRLAAALKAHPDWMVTIEGHTDNTGSDQHNLELSRRRAEALKSELVTRYGLPTSRLSTAGYGRTRPVDSNDTLDGRAHNRRVEIARRC